MITTETTLADEFSFIPQYNPNRLRVIHNGSDSQCNVYRRHRILYSPPYAHGEAYYHVEDTRGWVVGEAVSLSSLLQMLQEAVRSMGKLFAAEAEHDMEPAQEGPATGEITKESLLKMVEDSQTRIDSVIDSLLAVPDPTQERAAPRRASVFVNGFEISTPLFVSMSFVREAARDAGVLPDSPAVLDAKAGKDEWIAIPESEHAAEFFQVPIQAHFRHMPEAKFSQAEGDNNGN